MSARVDTANIAADQGRALFASAPSRAARASFVAEKRSVNVSFADNHRSQYPNRTLREDAETEKQICAKRHYSVSVDEKHAPARQRRYSDKFGPGSAPFNFRRRGGRMGRHHPLERQRIVLPTRFLLGGNITDPLNLNSLCDEEVNKSMNETTPIASPVPIPTHRCEVRVLVPTNSADPLNLSATEIDPTTELKTALWRRRRKRNRKSKNRTFGQTDTSQSAPPVKALHVEVDTTHEEQVARVTAEDTAPSSDGKNKRVLDHIVSPVIPQKVSKWKRRRTSSESQTKVNEDKSVEKVTPERLTGIRAKRRQLTSHTMAPRVPVFRRKDERFSHGGYSAGTARLGDYDDGRVACFSRQMISGKDVLDVGCGVGHMALSLAREFEPRHVVGIDIDRKLVEAALKNRQHYETATLPDVTQYPLAVRRRLGPLAAPSLHQSHEFPHSVEFYIADYVPQSEEVVARQQEEYDVILALRITKWIHLNYGDVGLKRAFRRMYRQLRPGGLLVLEVQPWKSYRKKKKLTEQIFRTYRTLQFRPDAFTGYLLSREVGFASSERLRPGYRRCTGVKQPLVAFRKPVSAAHPPLSASQSCTSLLSGHLFSQSAGAMTAVGSVHDTPDCTSSCCWLTPQFEIGSTSSSTPCSTHCRNTPGGDDVAASPYSSSSSSSSSSSPSSQSEFEPPPSLESSCDTTYPAAAETSERTTAPNDNTPSGSIECRTAVPSEQSDVTSQQTLTADPCAVLSSSDPSPCLSTKRTDC